MTIAPGKMDFDQHVHLPVPPDLTQCSRESPGKMDFEEFLNFMAAVKTTSQEEGAGAGQRAAASAAQSGADKVAKLLLREWRSPGSHNLLG